MLDKKPDSCVCESGQYASTGRQRCEQSTAWVAVVFESISVIGESMHACVCVCESWCLSHIDYYAVQSSEQTNRERTKGQRERERKNKRAERERERETNIWRLQLFKDPSAIQSCHLGGS